MIGTYSKLHISFISYKTKMKFDLFFVYAFIEKMHLNLHLT